MAYSTLLLAATTRLSRCALPVKRLLQRSVLLALGSATAVTFAAPVRAEVLAALSFDLDGAGQNRQALASPAQPGLSPAESSASSSAESPVESLDGVVYAVASTGVAKSYAGQPAKRAEIVAPAGLGQTASDLAGHSFVSQTPVGGQAIAPSPSQSQESQSQESQSQKSSTKSSAASTDPIPAQWWEQGSDSPIAVAIGNAEGTRQPDGSKNTAYYWHQDPGNGADNFGTFSYQHFPFERTSAVRAETSITAKREVAAAQSLPEIADQEQMQRLRGFYRQLQRQAQENGLVLTPLEALNGLDLINQSEAAGLSPGGYIDRLVKMRSLEEDVEEQIKEARSWSYWHPERQAWDAPGLGNGYQNVRRDQDRRFEAVKRAMEEYIPNGEVLVAQTPNALQAQSEDASQDGVSEENLLATAARVTQADALSFGLSKVVAMTGFGQ